MEPRAIMYKSLSDFIFLIKHLILSIVIPRKIPMDAMAVIQDKA